MLPKCCIRLGVIREDLEITVSPIGACRAARNQRTPLNLISTDKVSVHSRLSSAISNLRQTKDDTKAADAIDAMLLAFHHGDATSRTRLEQQDCIAALLATIDSRIAAASSLDAATRTRRVISLEQQLLVDCASLLLLLLSRSSPARRCALRAGAPRILATALAAPAAGDPLRRAAAALVTALCREGDGARAAAAAGEGAAVGALIAQVRRRDAEVPLRRAAAEALDAVCGTPAGAAAALPQLPLLIEAMTPAAGHDPHGGGSAGGAEPGGDGACGQVLASAAAAHGVTRLTRAWGVGAGAGAWRRYARRSGASSAMRRAARAPLLPAGPSVPIRRAVPASPRAWRRLRPWSSIRRRRRRPTTQRRRRRRRRRTGRLRRGACAPSRSTPTAPPPSARTQRLQRRRAGWA